MDEFTLPTDCVGDDERVARVLFAPSYLSEGRVAPTAFRWYVLKSGTVEKYISVLRDNGGDVEAQSRKFVARDEGDERYGYTWLKAIDIRGLNHFIQNSEVQLKPFPTRTLSNHAGIEVYIGDCLVDATTPPSADLNIIQKLLASVCCPPIPFELIS